MYGEEEVMAMFVTSKGNVHVFPHMRRRALNIRFFRASCTATILRRVVQQGECRRARRRAVEVSKAASCIHFFPAKGAGGVTALFWRDSRPVPLRVLQLRDELRRRQGTVSGTSPVPYSLCRKREEEVWYEPEKRAWAHGKAAARAARVV